VRARRALARERLPSYREPASRNPQAVLTETFRKPRSRAPFRLLPIRAPRQAVLRTSSRLAPSRITNRPCDLPVEKTRDASNRCLPPILELRAPAPRAFPARSRGFRRVDPHGVSGSVRWYRGTGRFTTSDSASADRASSQLSSFWPHGLAARAWALSSHGDDPTEPMTPLSRAPFTLTPRPLSRPLLLRRPSAF